MPNWEKLLGYFYRTMLFLFAILSAVSAVFLVSSGAGVVVLFIVAFFSLILSIRLDNLRIKIRDYELDLGKNVSEGYDGLIEHTKDASNIAAQSLQKVKNVSSGDPFHDLSVLIESGIRNRDMTAADQLLNNLKINISSRKYLERFEDTEMKVVRFENNDLYVNSSGKEGYLKRGMRFRVYRDTVQLSDDTAEEVTEFLGIASVELASKGTTKMTMKRWAVDFDSEEVEEIRNNELKGKKLYADILIPESVAETPIEELEQAYEQLKPIRSNP